MVSNFSEADLTSFCDSVYTQPLLVRGSTIAKTSFTAIITVCSDGGYLNKFDSPGGYSNFSLTWLHLDLSEAHKSTTIFCQASNKSWNWLRYFIIRSSDSSLQELDAENAFTLSVSFEIGMKEWSLRVPGIVCAFKNRSSSLFFCFIVIRTAIIKVNIGNIDGFPVKQLMWSHYLIIVGLL